MGEYAHYKSKIIKIGTCEMMYYLRYEDRFKVKKHENSLDPHIEKNLFWRLPFSDEDEIELGNYKQDERGISIIDDNKELAKKLCENPRNIGTIYQGIEHTPIRIILNCYHGARLPIGSDEIKIQKMTYSLNQQLQLCYVKNDEIRGIRPIIKCSLCENMWSFDITEVEKYFGEDEVFKRVKNYTILDK